jgi:broad specificity phosphatase PhoE
MTTLLIVRHGQTDANGQLLAGWKPGWHLNPRGKQQAERLAERLANLPLAAVYASPLERAIETAGPIARRHSLSPIAVDDLGEWRQGEWEGKTFAELADREDWQSFNAWRSSVRPPGGELMIESQARMIRQLDCLTRRHPNQHIALVSHGDPLRALFAHCLGIPLDNLLRFEISPGSLSILQASEWGYRVLCLNQTEDLPL